MKTLLIALVSFAGLGMAQNCAATNTCHIDQTSTTTMFAENGQNVCFFSQSVPEIINWTCKTSHAVKASGSLVFFIGDCHSGNFLGITDIEWKFCRVTDTTYSWQVDVDTSFVKTGSLL